MPCPTSSPKVAVLAAPLRGLCGALIALLVAAFPARAQWRLEAWFGDAISLPTGIRFSQVDRPVISATGRWSTEPFRPTWYYAGRIAKWSGEAAWGFEYIHHKIYMDNPPLGVQYFRVTNGVNFFLAERLWRRHGWEFGGGAGPVLAVPVSSVRGIVYDNADGIFHSQYELSGAGIQANVARRLKLLPWVYGSLSLKATAAYLHVHLGDGHAVTMNYALHAEYGISLQSHR